MSASENGNSETRPQQHSLEDKFSLLLDQMKVMNGNLERLISDEQQEPGPSADGNNASDRGRNQTGHRPRASRVEIRPC